MNFSLLEINILFVLVKDYTLQSDNKILPKSKPCYFHEPGTNIQYRLTIKDCITVRIEFPTFYQANQFVTIKNILFEFDLARFPQKHYINTL